MAQLWPRTDNFDNSLTYGDKLSLYLSCRPSTTVGSFVPASVMVEYDVFGQKPSTPAVVKSLTTATNDQAAFLWRDYSATDVSAEVTTSLQNDPGSTQLDQAFITGPIVRATGGTLGGSNDEQTVDDLSCYAAWVVGSGSGTGTFQWSLVRYNAGAVTSLATGSLPYVAFGTIDAAFPYKIRLSAVDESGDVRLRAYITTVLTVGGAAVPVDDFALVTYLDASAGKLTAAGRAGFISTAMQAPATSQFVGQRVWKFHVHSVNAAGVKTGTVIEDDFKRAVPQKGYLDSISTKQLASADSSFLADMRGWNLSLGFPATARLLNGVAGGGTADWLSAFSTFAYYWTCCSQRPVNDEQHQHPEITFQWATSGLTQPRVGVFGYVSAVPNPGAFMLRSTVGILADCYAVWADYDAQELYVERCVKNGGKIRLAQHSTTLALTTDYRLGLQITPTTGAGAGTSLVIYLNGSPVVPTIASGAPAGVTVDPVTAEIIDQSSSRYTSGQFEGIAFYEPVLGKRIRITKWDEGTLSPPTPIDDMTSIVFADEGTPSATFQLSSNRPVPLRSPVSYDHGHEVLTTAFDSGHIHARTLRPPRKVWEKIQTVPVDRSDRDELRTFWRARGGGVEPFFWTSPDDDVTYTVRFLPDSWEEVELFRDIWQVSFGLEEVL